MPTKKATKKKAKYIPGSEKPYSITILASLIVIGLAIGGIIYSLIVNTPEDLNPIFELTENGVNPGTGMVPSGPPTVPAPLSGPTQ